MACWSDVARRTHPHWHLALLPVRALPGGLPGALLLDKAWRGALIVLAGVLSLGKAGQQGSHRACQGPTLVFPVLGPFTFQQWLLRGMNTEVVFSTGKGERESEVETEVSWAWSWRPCFFFFFFFFFFLWYWG
jgi:hypothetical protein